jgi:hypothetical protein
VIFAASRWFDARIVAHLPGFLRGGQRQIPDYAIAAVVPASRVGGIRQRKGPKEEQA